MSLNGNLFTTTFDNYNKRRKKVKDELKKINTEITKVTGRVTLMKYRIQKFLVDYQQTLHQKSEVDKLLSFHLSTSLSHPKMGIEGYTYELERITLKYEYFKEKFINKIPNTLTSDINIYFPELNRWKVDHLEEIRKEAKNLIDTTHSEHKKRELELFEDYQEKKHKLEWMLEHIEKDLTINVIERRKKIIAIKDALKKLEREIFDKISSDSFPPLMEQIEMIEQMSNNELRRLPIKLDEDPDDKPEVRFIKRKLILLNMEKNRCKNKIDKLCKEMEDNASEVDTTKLYESAKKAGEFTHSVSQKKAHINKMKQDLKEMETYMYQLLESRDILVEEVKLLENMESLTHNDIIYELIKKKPQRILHADVEEDFVSIIPPDCIVNDDGDIISDTTMTDISNLGDNLDIDNIDIDLINDEIVQILSKQTQPVNNEIEEEITKINAFLDDNTKNELHKLKYNQKNISQQENGIFMEIEKNITKADLPESTKNKLIELDHILDMTYDEYNKQNEQDDMLKAFERELDNLN